MITSDMLTRAKLCDAGAANKWAPFFDAACSKFEIDTPMRIAAFLAQCAYESGNFRKLEENMNYSADGLLATFPKYFDRVSAQTYARQPERIANRVYGGRYGNAGESTGDGFKYRGRGLLQITFKDNYRQYGQAIGQEDDILANPGKLSLPEHAAMSAAWFWRTRKLNLFADAKDITSITKVINGGTNGLPDRIALYNQVATALANA